MVQSLINPDVHYPEADVGVDLEDVGYSSTVCELEFPNQEGRFMLIALGKLKYTFHERGILYYPVYLLSLDDRKTLGIKAKIGVAEVPVKHALDILDEKKQVRLDMLEDPLLFAFANEDYLERFSTDQAPTKKEEEKEEEEEEKEETVGEADDASDSVKQARQLLAHGLFSETRRKIEVPAPIPEETETEAVAIEDAFKEDKNKFWVQTWLKNDRFVKHAVMGSEADSLFACIVDAFQQMGKDTTVAKLRAVVALEATANIFRERREAYEHLAKTMDDKKLHVKKIKDTLLELNRKASRVQDLREDEYRTVTASLRDLELEKKDRADNLICDERLVQEMVGTEFRDVLTLGHFREFILTNRFHCDDWAIGVLEERVKAKMVIFSEAEFQDGDLDHVLRCCSRGPKKPEFYILLNKTARRYELVGYKNKDDVGKKLMTFPEIPWSLRQRMKQRCAESRGKGFDDVVRDLATQHGYEDADQEEEEDEDQVVFQFHRRAASHASPGKGPNEQIKIQQMHAFQPLRRIRAWRQKLDDAWQSKFSLDGKSWASVTHYTQSRHFRKKNPDYADSFALDSKTALSKSVDLAFSATTDKEVIQAKPSQIHVDKEFTEKEAQEARVKALHAKFTQNADLMQLLKATAPAKLMHYVPKRIPREDKELAAVRETL
jgi:predicted NAD-dependent protein-ADP-ribosyltransferase YbiA (DUF1768 family)